MALDLEDAPEGNEKNNPKPPTEIVPTGTVKRVRKPINLVDKLHKALDKGFNDRLVINHLYNNRYRVAWYKPDFDRKSPIESEWMYKSEYLEANEEGKEIKITVLSSSMYVKRTSKSSF